MRRGDHPRGGPASRPGSVTRPIELPPGSHPPCRSPRWGLGSSAARLGRRSASTSRRRRGMSPGAAKYPAHFAAQRKRSGSSGSRGPRSPDISAHSRPERCGPRSRGCAHDPRASPPGQAPGVVGRPCHPHASTVEDQTRRSVWIRGGEEPRAPAPSPHPNRTARSLSAASMTALMSSIRASRSGMRLTRVRQAGASLVEVQNPRGRWRRYPSSWRTVAVPDRPRGARPKTSTMIRSLAPVPTT